MVIHRPDAEGTEKTFWISSQSTLLISWLVRLSHFFPSQKAGDRKKQTLVGFLGVLGVSAVEFGFGFPQTLVRAEGRERLPVGLLPRYNPARFSP